MTGLARQIAVLAAIAFNLTLNALAGAGVLFGVQTGAVSDSIQTGVTPAGWAFSIWSVIFLGAMVTGIWQARPSARGARYDALAAPLIAANVLNGLWQIPWSLRLFGVAAVVIVGILASLAWLYVRLDRMQMTRAERWTLGVPVSLWFAWLCVATPLNITIALAAAGWTGGAIWPPLLVVVVAAVGVALLRNTGDVAFAGVLLWAYLAIWAQNGAGDPLLTGALAASAAAFVLSAGLAIRGGASPLPVVR
ncbi:MAG: tryptophan-rich sensory protein [Bacteroidota bacterium]